MRDDPFTKRILDYLQRIIYNGRQNVSSKEFFSLNVEHSISYIIMRKITLKILKMHLSICLKIVDGFSFSLKCKKEINQHENIYTTSYDRIIDSMFYC